MVVRPCAAVQRFLLPGLYVLWGVAMTSLDKTRVEFVGWQEDGLGSAFPQYQVYGRTFNGTHVGVETLVEQELEIPFTPSLSDWRHAKSLALTI